uniref:BTB domain-containing protein n=1 Tax=Panagrolaimus sp. ES5 TaxID=591445 RepID=A0AC34FPI4_9BILA
MDIEAMECEIAADWSIDKKALKEVRVGGNLVSPVFQTTIAGVEYYISIAPNDTSNDGTDGSYVNCCLYVETDTYIDANFTFTIPSANISKTCKSSACGDNEIIETVSVCSRESLFEPKNKYFQNEKLTLQLRGTFNINLIDNIEFESLGEMLWCEDNKDFTIQVEDKEIKAHKFILRQCSPFFEAMFNSGMKEAQESKVKFEGFSYDVVEMAVNFCYEFEYRHCSVDTLLSLLKFSLLYDIPQLK